MRLQLPMELLSPLTLVPTSTLTLSPVIHRLIWASFPFTSLTWLPCFAQQSYVGPGYAGLGYDGVGCVGQTCAHLAGPPLVTFHHCTASGSRLRGLAFLTGFTSFRLLPMFSLPNHPTRLQEPPTASFCGEQERTEFLSVAFDTLHSLV